MGKIKLFTMNEEQYAAIMEACKPTPVMYLSGGVPMYRSQQENANNAWEKLGKEMGFKHMTVSPAGSNPRNFNAESTTDD